MKAHQNRSEIRCAHGKWSAASGVVEVVVVLLVVKKKKQKRERNWPSEMANYNRLAGVSSGLISGGE